MSRIFPLLVGIAALAVIFTSSPLAFSDEKVQEVEQAQEVEQIDEVAVLKAEIAELRAQLEIIRWQNEALALRLLAPRLSQPSIGVMSIENWSWGLPWELRESLRQVIVSAFREAGLSVTESLDQTTLSWVQRQAQLVQQGWIDYQKTSPPELRGVSYMLIPTITSYRENEIEDVRKWGPILVKFDRRLRIGRLVMDFRLVDAVSGVAIDAFSAEAEVREKISQAGVILVYESRKHERPLPERAAREVAKQAAERVASLFIPQEPAEEEEK